MVEDEKIIESEEFVKKITKASEDIYSLWNDIKFDETSKMREVWTDRVGKVFVDRLLEIDGKINKAIEEMDSLKEAWIKYLHKLEEEKKKAIGENK